MTPRVGSKTGEKEFIMKKFLYMAVAAIAALSSCTNDDIVADENGNENQIVEAPVFTATIEGEGTRTQLVEGSTAGKLTKVAWLSTDQIYVLGINTGTDQTSVLGVYTAAPSNDNAAQATLTASSLKINNPELTATEYYAVYPASISALSAYSDELLQSAPAAVFRDPNGGIPTINLPATQTYNGTNISQIAPMYAHTTTTGTGNTELSFKNLTALLAITVSADDFSEVNNIVVKSDKAMNGAFAVCLSGNESQYSISSKTATDAQKTLTLNCQNEGANTTIAEGESKTFYVSIPPATYGYLQFEVNGKKGSTDVTKTMKTKAASITVARNKIYPIAFADNTGDPNLLPGEFSVGADKKVKFTKGNLWCNTTTNPVTYAFETNQYDYPVATNYTSDGTKDGTWYGTHVGHFYWTTAAAASYAQKNYYDSNTTSDKFWLDGSDASHKLTVSGTSDLYVLSKAEWEYLINTRDNHSNLCKNGVTVVGKTGCLIIAPDNYTGSIATEYTAAEWATAEAAGLVCLPFAGYRDNDHPFDAGTAGNYWASTPAASSANGAMRLCFMSEDVYTDLDNPRAYGFPLRLVK